MILFFLLFYNLLDGTSKALSSGCGLPCGAVQVCYPHKALIHVCEEGWFHPDRKMEQTCISSSSLKAFGAMELAGDLRAHGQIRTHAVGSA